MKSAIYCRVSTEGQEHKLAYFGMWLAETDIRYFEQPDGIWCNILTSDGAIRFWSVGHKPSIVSGLEEDFLDLT